MAIKLRRGPGAHLWDSSRRGGGLVVRLTGMGGDQGVAPELGFKVGPTTALLRLRLPNIGSTPTTPD